MEPKDISRKLYGEIRSRIARELVYDRVQFLKNLVRGKKVLDVGCVQHSLDNRALKDWVHGHLKETAADLTGLDYEAAEVEKMNALGYKAFSGDATAFDLQQKFEVIVAGEILEHIMNAAGFIRSAARHLGPGGVLVITVPNANSLYYFLQNLLFGYEIDGYDHVAFYSPMNMFNLLKKNGMRIKSLHFSLPDTSFHHRSKLTGLVVALARWVQWPFSVMRKTLCRQMIVVAELDA